MITKLRHSFALLVSCIAENLGGHCCIDGYHALIFEYCLIYFLEHSMHGKLILQQSWHPLLEDKESLPYKVLTKNIQHSVSILRRIFIVWKG